MKVYVPPIKCQGKKTKLVPWIRSIVPSDNCERWVEPFLGSGVVAFNVRPKKALLCDTNPHLIRFYQFIQDNKITPESVEAFLYEHGRKLMSSGGEYYYEVRERFNDSADPLDFLFLNRSCFNGMIRFNKKGGFNVPFCKKPERFAQAYITKITNQVRYVCDLFKLCDYTFKCQSFEDTLRECKNTDIIYCDPPYIDRHTDYYNGWSEKDEQILFELLSSVPARFILSTWHSNDYRSNIFIDMLWKKFNILTREHFYHVGGFEKNRNPMLEAVVVNYDAEIKEDENAKASLMQECLFDV